ncbi:hypothetical protein AYO38_08690 [bacterium SCGC AG-212-C10]|nr:hypothetical protein AYO38_08690 [bacterium SCGC AG-212-C10]
MAQETQAQAMGEIISWLEQQVRQSREEQMKAVQEIDALRRQLFDQSEQIERAERALREVDPKFLPYKGLPEKIRSLDESTEHIRQVVTSNRAELDNAIRLIRAEAEYDRQERADAFKRIDSIANQLGLALADIAQAQMQTSQVSQSVQPIIERQRETEQHVQQFGLRLDRSIEVHRDLDERIRESVFADLDDRFDVVYERLQLVGEMVKRNEDLISSVSAERTMREELLHEMAMWRDQQARTDSRIVILEEQIDKVLGQLDKLHSEITLLEGRHSGMGERVFAVRKDISEVVDQVRDEFTKFNQLIEKQRRKQIAVLEQELRELKFHSFRPPEEP